MEVTSARRAMDALLLLRGLVRGLLVRARRGRLVRRLLRRRHEAQLLGEVGAVHVRPAVDQLAVLVLDDVEALEVLDRLLRRRDPVESTLVRPGEARLDD